MARLPQTIRELASSRFPRAKGFFIDLQRRVGFRTTEGGKRLIRWFRLNLDRGGFILARTTQSPSSGAWYYPLREKNPRKKAKKKKKRRKGLDVIVEDYDKDMLPFTLRTAQAKEWVHSNLFIPSEMWIFPYMFVLKRKWVEEIVKSMSNDGLKVEIRR